MAKLRVCVTWASVGLGVVSAFCWWRAAVVKVQHAAGAQAQGPYRDGSSAVDGADMAATMRKQSIWNRWAAIAAAGAALAQAISAALPG
ncbi:hypothetical protein GALL_331760 [mine drainage metagenome]|uniref:Uncharacterized protein n=1 Tax=mine drainage metagenome TaxID=410659 RepID=A0A1J5QYR4_9ZZZZ